MNKRSASREYLITLPHSHYALRVHIHFLRIGTLSGSFTASLWRNSPRNRNLATQTQSDAFIAYLPNPSPVRIFNEMGPSISTALTLLYCKDQIVAGRNDATDEE